VRIKLVIIVFVSLLCNIASAQTFNYSYTDPCNGKVYNLSIPYGQNQIAVTYYGQVGTFTANDFNNGTFDNWAAGVFNQFQNASPCGGIGTTVTVSQTQSTALNVIGIFNSLSAISDIASSGTGNIMAAAGSVTSVGGGGNGDKDNKDNKNSSSGGGQSGGNNGSTTGGGSQGQTQSNGNNSSGSSSSGTTTGSNNNGGSGSESTGGTTTNGGSSTGSGETGGTSNTNTGGGSTGGSGGTTTGSTGSGGSGGNGSTNNQTQGAEEKKSDAVGGTTNAVKSGSSSGNGKSSTTSKNGGRPSILMSSDLVGFQFNEGEVSKGSKVNAGYSSVRYDGLRSHGIMVDYTSSIQGGNITGYYAWIKPKAITLLSNTVTIGFAGSGSIYNTVAFGQMRNIKK
jgi:hypothetical protein